MTAESVLLALMRINIVASATIVLVLVMRPSVLRWLSPKLTYGLWLIVPIAAAASLLPGPTSIEFIEPTAAIDFAEVGPSISSQVAPAAPSETTSASIDSRTDDYSPLLLAFWLFGAIGLFVRSVVGTYRFLHDPAAGPALVGILRPTLVLPADFQTRFSEAEQCLVLAHEEQHRRSWHPITNALVEVARCACWFNPLAHFASRQFRSDQELACDAAVVRAHPAKRRTYAEALLKTQIVPVSPPLVCTWTSRSAQALGDRISMLGRPAPSQSRAIVGTLSLAGLCIIAGYAAWAQQPDTRVYRVGRPAAVWTPASEAPDGVLSHELEGRRHDFFIELAQTRDEIPLVFFGTTDTEMWWWDRGQDIWQRAFEPLGAVNFGSQGTQPRSLLWRMQNGELDGFDAKLIVLQAWGIIGADNGTNYADGFLPIIAEIRLRQPQAKLLLMAPLPRGVPAGMARLDLWRQQAALYDDTMVALADGETVFYANFGDRFYNEDGSFKSETWRGGRRAPGFEIWADALQPWIERYVN